MTTSGRPAPLAGVVAASWDGRPAPRHEHVRVRVGWSEAGARVEIDAPYHGDPAPLASADAGPTWGLWDHEVAEVFLLGPDQRYTEIELGPHGHWLVLELAGVRQVTQRVSGLAAQCAIHGDRWTGLLEVPWHHLPTRLERWNAYAIHGVGSARRYLALSPVPGEAPDFHRLECFAPVGPSPGAEAPKDLTPGTLGPTPTPAQTHARARPPDTPTPTPPRRAPR